MYSARLGPISNRETWEQSIQVVDESGEDVTISSATIVVAVRKQGETSPVLTATNGSGVTLASPIFIWSFTVSQMSGLDAGNYEVGCTILISGFTAQLIVGTATVIDGIVS